MDKTTHDKHIRPLIQAGFHRAARMTKEAFAASIPPPPTPRRGTVPVLAIPESMVRLEEQLALAHITPQVPLEKIRLKGPNHDRPYWLHVQDGTKNKGKSPAACRASLGAEERGLTVTEGVALHLQHPEVTQDHSVDLIESSYAEECTPTIYRWEGRTRLSAICSDVADSMCGAATCLRERP